MDASFVFTAKLAYLIDDVSGMLPTRLPVVRVCFRPTLAGRTDAEGYEVSKVCFWPTAEVPACSMCSRQLNVGYQPKATRGLRHSVVENSIAVSLVLHNLFAGR